jgi:hypothetical protein
MGNKKQKEMPDGGLDTVTPEDTALNAKSENLTVSLG